MDEKTGSAFVVQLADPRQSDDEPVVGRVEHVITGRAARFDSVPSCWGSCAEPWPSWGAPASQLTEQAGSHREDSISERTRSPLPVATAMPELTARGGFTAAERDEPMSTSRMQARGQRWRLASALAVSVLPVWGTGAAAPPQAG